MSRSASSNTPIPTIAAPEMRVTTRAAEGLALSTSRAQAPTITAQLTMNQPSATICTSSGQPVSGSVNRKAAPRTAGTLSG